MNDRESQSAEDPLRNLRAIIQLFASAETAEELRLGVNKSRGFDSLELLELLEDIYPAFRPPIGEAAPLPGFVLLPDNIARELTTFYARVREVIDPSVVPRPVDSELMVSRTWAELQREAAHLDDLLSAVKAR